MSVSSKGTGSAIAGILALLAGCGQMLRVCSKTDDVVRLGKFGRYADETSNVRYLDDTRNVRYGEDALNSTRYAKQAGDYDKGTNFAKDMLDHQYTQQTSKLIDGFHERFLRHSNKKYASEMDALEANSKLKEDAYKFNLAKEDVVVKHQSDLTQSMRNSTFKTIKTSLKLSRHLHNGETLATDLRDDKSYILRDTGANLSGLKIQIDKGSILVSDEHMIAWAQENYVGQVVLVPNRIAENYIQLKILAQHQSRDHSSIIRDFKQNEDQTFTFNQDFELVYGKYETITRRENTVLIEVLSKDSSTTKNQITRIVNDLIND